MDEEILKLQKDQDWKLYVLSRCSELEPKVMGSVEPSTDEALLYFKFHDILFSVFGIGKDLSNHPRNPFTKKEQKNLDNHQSIIHNSSMTEKEQEIKTFLQKEVQELHPRIFGQGEPLMTDRMTFFAYNQYLYKKFGVGQDLKNHPRNPWAGIEAPLDFSDYSQIRKLPEHLRVKPPLNQTQVIPFPEREPVAETMFRVYDVDHPNRTVFQGTEAECYRYSAKANKETGYKAFDYINTTIKIFPKNKSGNGSIQTSKTYSIQKSENGCSCDVPNRSTYVYKDSKKKVQEYLARCREQQAIKPEEPANQEVK